MVSRIDAHQHFWWLGRGDYTWIDPHDRVLAQDYTPERLKPLLSAAGVARTVVVQAASTVAESEHLLAIAADTDFVAGVVGWVDLDNPMTPTVLDRLQRYPGFVGLRPAVPRSANGQVAVNPIVLRNLAEIRDRHLRIDWLIAPRDLPMIATMMDEIPDLAAVIDHLGNPVGDPDQWAQAIAYLAQHPRCHCKISGLGTMDSRARESHGSDWQRESVGYVWSLFGSDRLMYGSDWPVCLKGGTSYADTVTLIRSALPPLTPSQDEAVFGGNAARFYGLTEGL